MARPLSESARAKMILATQEVARVHGVDGVTVEAIARRSGVAKTTIYRHFGSADELLLAAVEEMIEEIEPPDTGSFRSDVRAVIGAFMRLAAVPELRHLFVSMLGRAIDDPEFADLYRSLKEQRHQPLRIAVQRGIARGEVDPAVDIEQALSFVQGPFIGKRIIENEDLTDRDLEVFLDLIVKALAPPG
jgi:AcrR family transcriptional regulator